EGASIDVADGGPAAGGHPRLARRKTSLRLRLAFDERAGIAGRNQHGNGKIGGVLKELVNLLIVLRREAVGGGIVGAPAIANRDNRRLGGARAGMNHGLQCVNNALRSSAS